MPLAALSANPEVSCVIDCPVAAQSDENLAQKLRERHKAHPYFSAPKREALCFTVKHYAGDVTYLTTGPAPA